MLVIEDPTLNLIVDPQTQQIQLWGLGALHLRVVDHRAKNCFATLLRWSCCIGMQIAQERLHHDYHVETVAGRMEISYLVKRFVRKQEGFSATLLNA